MAMRASNFRGGAEKYFEEMKSVNISNLFGLSRVQGLPSVAQQLEIWENELNCLTSREGVLIIFETAAQHAEFKQFKDANMLKCLLWSEEWKIGKKNVVVVDRAFER